MIRYEPQRDETIQDVCRNVAKISWATKQEVSFEFERVELVASPADGWKELHARWKIEIRKRQWNTMRK